MRQNLLGVTQDIKFTSFSNRTIAWPGISARLSTIHIYIILKRTEQSTSDFVRLSTIHIYIILKQKHGDSGYGYRLSTIHIYIILKPQIQK